MADSQNYSKQTRDSLIQRIRFLEDRLKQTSISPYPATPDAREAASPAADARDGEEKPKRKKKQGVDASQYSTRYIALKLAYLGKRYLGFEYVDSGALPTIEEELWKALVKTCLVFPGPGKQPGEVDFSVCEFSKCGRTDRGVSAFGQVVGLRVRSNKPVKGRRNVVAKEGQEENGVSSSEKAVEEEKSAPRAEEEDDETAYPVDQELNYPKILNRVLPPDIRILAWCPTPPSNFSARFSCRERQYKYFFTQPAFLPLPSSSSPGGQNQGTTVREGDVGSIKGGWLHIEAMRDAAKRFEGLHDFRNFCKVDPNKQIVTFLRRIFESDIVEVKDVGPALPFLKHEGLVSAEANSGETRLPKLYSFNVRGSAFLWHQIRHMVGMLFLVGQGLEKPSVITELLNVEKWPRKPIYNMADDAPLVLWDCVFPAGAEGADHRSDKAALEASGESQGDQVAILNGDEGNELDMNLKDSLDWHYGTQDQPLHLANDMWSSWRAAKMDEILANRLLEATSQRLAEASDVLPAATAAAATSSLATQRMFEGGHQGRPNGKYVPVLQRALAPSPQETNDRYAQRKGFANSQEMRAAGNWRVVIQERKNTAKKKMDGP